LLRLHDINDGKMNMSMEWYREGKTEVLEEKPLPGILSAAQIPQELVP
jgi:hypothetical protein